MSVAWAPTTGYARPSRTNSKIEMFFHRLKMVQYANFAWLNRKIPSFWNISFLQDVYGSLNSIWSNMLIYYERVYRTSLRAVHASSLALKRTWKNQCSQVQQNYFYFQSLRRIYLDHSLAIFFRDSKRSL